MLKFVSFFLCAICFWSHAAQSDIRKFEVILGATRLIYDLDGKGETIHIKNPQSYPILIQSKVLDNNGKDDNNYIVTPPLFRLDGGKETDLQVVLINKDIYHHDRETLRQLCIKGIPPKSDDIWSNESKIESLKLNISINTCIKLIVRPSKLPGLTTEHSKMIKWSMSNNRIFAKNNSPNYITLASLKFNGFPIDASTVIPPFSEVDFVIKRTRKDNFVEWVMIGDLGEEMKSNKYILESQ